MKIRRKRFSPKSAGAAQSRSPLAERLARHLRWSAAISAAFLRADGLPRRSATFTFGLRAKRMWLLVRRVRNFQLSWPRLEETLTITNNFLKEQAIARNGRSPVEHSRPHLCSPPLAFRHDRLLETFSHVDKLSQQRIWLPGQVSSMPSWRMLSPKTISSAIGRDGLTREMSGMAMTTRILRRLNRVEERPLSPEPRRVSGASEFDGFEGKLETSARRRRRDLDGAAHRSGTAASVPMPASINMTQLTDEVMRQLDRRLVALRERMGKI